MCVWACFVAPARGCEASFFPLYYYSPVCCNCRASSRRRTGRVLQFQLGKPRIARLLHLLRSRTELQIQGFLLLLDSEADCLQTLLSFFLHVTVAFCFVRSSDQRVQGIRCTSSAPSELEHQNTSRKAPFLPRAI